MPPSNINVTLSVTEIIQTNVANNMPRPERRAFSNPVANAVSTAPTMPQSVREIPSNSTVNASARAVSQTTAASYQHMVGTTHPSETAPFGLYPGHRQAPVIPPTQSPAESLRSDLTLAERSETAAMQASYREQRPRRD
jgi:hypothetical protein